MLLQDTMFRLIVHVVRVALGCYPQGNAMSVGPSADLRNFTPSVHTFSVVSHMDRFTEYSGEHPNWPQCEVAGSPAILNGVQRLRSVSHHGDAAYVKSGKAGQSPSIGGNDRRYVRRSHDVGVRAERVGGGGGLSDARADSTRVDSVRD